MILGFILDRWKSAWSAVLYAASNLFPAIEQWRVRKAKKYRQLGIDAYHAKDLGLAVYYLKKAIDYAPEDAGFHTDVGQIYYEMGQFASAENHFRRALRYDYSNLRALKGLGHTLQVLYRFSEAISVYSRYLELNPKDADVYFNLGLAMSDSGDAAGALKSYAGAAELAPDNPHILVVWAEALYLAGKIDQALANLRRALALNPRDSELYRRIGLVLEANGDIDEASNSYMDAIRLDGRNPRAHLDFSSLLDKNGRHREAVSHATEAMTLFEQAGNKIGIAAAFWNLGWFYYHLHEFDRSAEASKNAIAINPKLIGAQFNLGLALLYLGREQEAIEEYKTGAEGISSASDLKYWAIDDLQEALETSSPPPGGEKVLSILRDKYERLKEVRKTAGAAYARS
jgi:tetratricopeptide (TPR) repeat protein